MSENVPNVTGISPAEGPPGTVVKIRGENLGKNASDLLGVFICSVNCTCTAEWHPHYISCRTGMGLGNGSIIVVTKSGGKGTSTVKFRGYMPRVGLLTESAVWVDESKLFEEKPTSGLSVSRPLSPSYMANDPLGVAPEETGNFLPVDKLDEMYPKSSGNSLFENFHPARFLLEKHLDTSFDSLKSGFYHLESQDTRSSSGPTSHVRSNLGTILESLDILAEVQQAMYDDKMKSVGGSVTEELTGVLNNCSSIANSMFKDILSRKDDADAKRNALNVFQRFKFLFNLQRNIEKNIRQGDYEIVISDYNRAKALFQNSEVKSFKKVIEKVDSQINSFMAELKKKLFEFPSTLDEQRRLIRYLTDLDCPGDPAWDCIVNMQQWIKNLFIECKNHYQRNESTGNLSLPSSKADARVLISDGNKLGSSNEFKAKHTRTPSDGSRSSYFKSAKKSHSRSSSLTLTSTFSESLSFLGLSSDATPCSIQFIEKLCDLIVDNIPDLWQLGKAYLSGQVGNKVVLLSEDREAMAKHTKKFSAMVLEIIKLFCNLTNAVLRPNSIVTLKEADRTRFGGWARTDTLVAWLPGCGQQISSAFYTLQSLELPANSLSLLDELAKKVCEQCVKEVLKASINEVKVLENRESWDLVYDESNTCISKLPFTFEKIVSDSILFIKNFMAATKIDDKERNKSLFDYIIDSVKKLLEAFANCLSTIVTKEEELDSKIEKPASGIHGQHNNVANINVKLDRKLLITLSNCNYLKSVLLPRIAEKCSRCGFEELQNIEPIFTMNIDEIYNRVFEKYIENKGEPLVGGIEQGMLLGEYRWEDDLPFVGVRPYIRELVLALVVIHNQVSAVSASFVQRIFERIGDMVAEETKRIFDCYSKFSVNGALQAYLEISVLEGCLKYHLTPEAMKMLNEAKNHLPSPSQDNKWIVEDMVLSFNKQMFFELVCFWPPEEVSKFEEKHGLLVENNDKERKSVSKQSEAPPAMVHGKSNDKLPAAPPKAPRAQEVDRPPPKAQRGKQASSVVSSKAQDHHAIGNSSSKAKTLFEVSKKKETDNPFLDDDDESDRLSEEKPSNPFEDEEQSNPFLDSESSNPFLDDDIDEKQSSNPFLE